MKFNRIIMAAIFICLSIFIISCSNELSPNRAFKICEVYVKQNIPELPTSANPNGFKNIAGGDEIDNFFIYTFIAIDQTLHSNYGWAFDKYQQLRDQGLITLTSLNYGGSTYLKVMLTDKGRDYYVDEINYISNVNMRQFVFYSCRIECNRVDISSTAKDKKAKAEFEFRITKISPIKEVFDRPKEWIKRIDVNFELYDNGWKIVDDANAKKLLQFRYYENPMH